ncbi:MAG: sugar phosphate isomerase/epimerase [Gemmatimonadaceae bacterium]
MDRRDFLRLGGTVSLSVVWGGVESLRTAAGEAVDEENVGFPISAVGLQLYTVRTLMEQSIEHTLEQVAAAGYRVVETAGLYDHQATAFRALLDKNGLRSPSGHYGLDQLERSADGVFATAQALGQEWVVVPSVPEALRGSRAAYGELADRFNRLGEKCRAAGLRFAYHNHSVEFESLGGSSPAHEILLARTDAALVSFELDAFWAYKAGYDPARYLERFPGRFSLCHVKDGTAPPKRDMVDVGAGVIDFRRVFAASRSAGLRYAFVEHDEAGDPIKSMRASYNYLARLLRPISHRPHARHRSAE